MKWLLIAALGTLVCRGALADDAPAPLKLGTGADMAGAYCNVCHTSDYIIMNSMFLTPDQWKAEVTKMRTVFGAPIDDATAGQIIAYLATHYAAPAKP